MVPTGKRKSQDEESRDLVTWMISYQNGDLEAFEALYRALQARLRYYLCSLTMDRARAEDLLQETFLQMHRSRRTYRPDRPVLPWVFGVARNVYLMDQRCGVSRRRHEVDMRPDLPEIPGPAAVDGWADRETVRRALRGVSPKGREALLLHQVWGFTFVEIGKLLGIGRNTAKLRAYRALQELRRELGCV